jgi:lambda family phage portal protein
MALRDFFSGLMPRRSGQALPAPRAALPPRVGAPSRALRSFMAASNDRLVADLMSIAGLASGNSEMRGSLRTMRIRSRQLANDNEYAKRFFQLLRNNVVGPHGFGVQMKIYKPRGALDDKANAMIESAWAEMSRRGVFTACGTLSRRAFDRAALTQCAREGEVLIEVLYGARFNRFGVAFRLLDPDLIDESLNVGYGGAVPGYAPLTGAEIRMGVERDGYGRPVAYWMHNVHPADDVVNVPVLRHRRVPADRIIHRFLAEEQRADTVRGVPWLFVAMRRVAMLGGYEEAALVNARHGASKMGFYKQPEGDAASLTGDGTKVAGAVDSDGRLIDEAEPGTFGVLPPGWSLETYNPSYPNEQMDGFVKGMLRAFAAGVGINYNVLASDLEGVNYSSLRQGALDDRDTYEALQQWYVDEVARPMFELWLRFALDMGQIGTLPIDAFDRVNCPLFIPRTWRWVDPLKEVSGKEKELALGITSRTRLCAEQGLDFETLVDERRREEELLRAAGITLGAATTATAQPAPAAEPDDDEAEDAATPETEGSADA